jgi:predicted phosphoribosyltransferase
MFIDRAEGGEKLAERLGKYKGKEGVLVLAIPRGGVVTGYEIAKALEASLDIIIIRKIGFPGNPEFGIGAVCETGAVVLDEETISRHGVTKGYIDKTVAVKKKEIETRLKKYRKGKTLPDLTDKTVILVDDGVATGSTVKAAIQALRREKLEKLVVAIPVAPPQTAIEIERMADEFVCLATPEAFMAVGMFYQDFAQVSDEEVVSILEKNRRLGD